MLCKYRQITHATSCYKVGRCPSSGNEKIIFDVPVAFTEPVIGRQTDLKAYKR